MHARNNVLKYRNHSMWVIIESFVLNMNQFNPCRYILVILCCESVIIVLDETLILPSTQFSVTIAAHSF